jgi:hypothetical protein
MNFLFLIFNCIAGCTLGERDGRFRFGTASLSIGFSRAMLRLMLPTPFPSGSQARANERARLVLSGVFPGLCDG